MNTLFQTLAFIGALAIVIGAVFFWAKVIRKTRKRRYEYPKPGASKLKAAPQSSTLRKQRRRRRRSEPPANPTLAETRGLPPVREDQRAVAEHYQN